MGTRNITSVIMNGKQVVCQYGQWDGYPSYTGTKILKFLRDADFSRLKKALENTAIVVTDYEKAVSYTGSAKDYSAFTGMVTQAKSTLSDKNGRWPDLEEVFQYLNQQGTASEDDLENYFAWTRDTGCEILPLIYNRSQDKPPLELAAMTNEYNGEYAWDIQGIYVLNMDDSTVKMTFDGSSCEFKMDALPADIENTMLVFEKTAEVLYMRRRNDSNFLAHAQDAGTEKGSDGLWNMAVDIVAEISTKLKEEDPELFSDTLEAFLAEDVVKEFTYGLLCENAKADVSKVKSAAEPRSPLTDQIQSAESRAVSSNPNTGERNTEFEF